MSEGDSLRSHVSARDGAACIYAEKHWIAHAIMSIASFTDTYLDLRFRRLDTPGFVPPDPSLWEAGVALADFRFSPDCWVGSPYAAWIVALAPEIITAMSDVAQAVKNKPPEERAVILRVELGELLWPEVTDTTS
jgi:hypothetical protein